MSTRKGTIKVNGAALDRGRSADMAPTGAPTMTRVVSGDGTEIADWTSGEGPPLVLVHGAAADHTRWRPLLSYLESYATVHAIDRRGRGASGDGSDYDVAREFEDVAAVVDAVAQASGSAVDLYGHSFGGFCAFGGALLTANLGRLVLYEGWPRVDPDARDLPPGCRRAAGWVAGRGEPRRGRRDRVPRGRADARGRDHRAPSPARVAGTRGRHASPPPTPSSASSGPFPRWPSIPRRRRGSPCRPSC